MLPAICQQPDQTQQRKCARQGWRVSGNNREGWLLCRVMCAVGASPTSRDLRTRYRCKRASPSSRRGCDGGMRQDLPIPRGGPRQPTKRPQSSSKGSGEFGAGMAGKGLNTYGRTCKPKQVTGYDKQVRGRRGTSQSSEAQYPRATGMDNAISRPRERRQSSCPGELYSGTAGLDPSGRRWPLCPSWRCFRFPALQQISHTQPPA